MVSLYASYAPPIDITLKQRESTFLLVLLDTHNQSQRAKNEREG